MMMKKRLLALILCLVMVSSLLPITAAAIESFYVTSVTINASGVENRNGEYYLQYSDWKVKSLDGDEIDDQTPDVIHFPFQIHKDDSLCGGLTDFPEEGTTYYFRFALDASHLSDIRDLRLASNFSATLNIDGYKTDIHRVTNNFGTLDIIFTLTKDHDWKFTVSESSDTLTAQCQNQECRKEVSVTLKADSVTLPKSPFETAQLVGWNDFQTATGARKEDFVYRYKGPGDAAFGDPFYADPAKIKAGQYQVGVTITNLPGNVEDGNVAARANTNSAYLFTQYTAADPAVTAQTGDDRPIEIMLVCALAFSALAAAAFILDSKRKYSR